MIVRKINRAATLARKTITEFFTMWRNYGFAYATYGLLWWLCFYVRTPMSYKVSSFATRKKTQWLDKYIEKHYADIINRYRNNPPAPIPTDDSRIWVFWGQGETQMPPLIEACHRQLKHFNPNVTLVTKENVGDYIDLSPVIINKAQNGLITWAHFSDIVRNTLLARHGGLWLDATVWVSGTIPMDKLATIPFFTANSPVAITPSSMCFWTSFEWNWSSWCLWSNCKNKLLFSFVSDMLTNIAKREQCWPDYVIQDYLIYYACRTFPSVRDDMEQSQSLRSVYRNRLAEIMNQPFDEGIYKKLTESDFVFKLSFRTSWVKETSQGQQTFYGRILSGIIEPKV